MLGLRQRCVLKADSSLRKPSSRIMTFSGGNSQSSNWISCEVLAAHRVIACRDLETRRAWLDQNTADAVAARLAVDPGEDDEPCRLVGPADQRLDPVERWRVADLVDVGPVVRDVGAGVGLGHADGSRQSPEHTFGRMRA